MGYLTLGVALDPAVWDAHRQDGSERSVQPESNLKWFNGMKHIRERWWRGWGDLGLVGVINIVIVAVQHVESFDRQTPFLVDLIPKLCDARHGNTAASA